MKLTFIGADHEVTGSCHYLEAAGKKILVDCGMEQGRDMYENAPIPVKAEQLDYVFVTHAHIDHTGNLPKLAKEGYRGQVYATEATCDLCQIMLLDSAHIQEFEAEWRNRKGKRLGKEEFVPAYTTDDVMKLLELLIPCDYKTWIDVCEGIRIRFTDVGHLLGSSAIEVEVTENGEVTTLVFSGDLGNSHQPLLKEPEIVENADYLLIESTYGDRSHGPRPDYVNELAGILQKTFDRGGNVVIPSFAVGRTQEMLYFIRQIKEQGLIQGHDGFEVYVDSPLAVKSTTIYQMHNLDCFDDEARALISKGVNPISFPNLMLAQTADESKMINFNPNPKVIISASGMCEAGRIKHHLKHNLWRPECTVLFVGYQAEGTLGRALLEGKQEVTLFGEAIAVQAEICVLPGVSGHADREGLLAWAGGIKNKPKKVFVVHGDDDVVGPFAELLHDTFGWDTYAPYSGTVYDLTANEVEFAAVPKPMEKSPAAKPLSPGAKTANALVLRLLNAANRLMNIVKRSDGRPNKDLTRMARDIESICDKYE